MLHKRVALFHGNFAFSHINGKHADRYLLSPSKIRNADA